MYAKITRDLTDTGERLANITPVPPDQLAPGKPYWVPIREVVVNNATTANTVSSSTTVIAANEVVVTTIIRDKTEAEIEAEIESDLNGQMDGYGIPAILIRNAFAQENRIRALEALPPLTLGEFLSALRVTGRP